VSLARAEEPTSGQQPVSPCHDGLSPRAYVSGDVVAGKYRLQRKAGEGGMGEVWVATNAALETSVAIKLIRAEAQRAGASERSSITRSFASSTSA
jgi:serine/threonine protein kinase